VAVETSVELPSIPLRIHPNCQCVTEPVVTTGRHRWDDIRWDERSGQRPRAGEIAPERTAEGDFIFYHGTSEAGAKAIMRERLIRPDDLNMVGVSTTPSQARSYAAIKKGPVLKVWVPKDEIQRLIARHEIGGSGVNQILFRPPRESGGPLRSKWEGMRL
jgi:hypothetical protein